MKKLANMKKPMIANRSGANSTLGTRPFLRHARESGHPGQVTETPGFPLSRRFRGNDEIENEQYFPNWITASFAGATGKRRWGSFVSFAPVASRDRGRELLILQPIRVVLLQICCRCSHRRQLVQFMIAGLSTNNRTARMTPVGRRRISGDVLRLSAGQQAPGDAVCRPDLRPRKTGVRVQEQGCAGLHTALRCRHLGGSKAKVSTDQYPGP